MLALVALALAQAADTPATDGPDIIVQARNRGCETRVADRILSDQELDSRVRGMGTGRVVRVRAAADADMACLTKIAFRLADLGVRNMVFVDPRGRPAQPLRASPSERQDPGPNEAEAAQTQSDREQRFIARRAARLILEGKCAEAKRSVLEAGDLASAAHVATICHL